MQYPEEAGADRLVNALSAWYQYATDLIVVDFGTAITFDCMTREREYLGGSILPGIAISLDALSSGTARLPFIDITVPPETVIGKNTVQAMKSGVLYGYGAMVDGLVDILAKEMAPPSGKPRIIATGGMADLILPYSQRLEKVDKMLTLKGLQRIFRHIHADA